jgi:hypothetical protein
VKDRPANIGVESHHRETGLVRRFLAVASTTDQGDCEDGFEYNHAKRTSVPPHAPHPSPPPPSRNLSGSTPARHPIDQTAMLGGSSEQSQAPLPSTGRGFRSRAERVTLNSKSP